MAVDFEGELLIRRSQVAKQRVAVVGAGFSGAVIAHRLAAAGQSIVVFEARQHPAGNCHTARDAVTGIMLHAYGPHIFHTDDETVWKFVNRLDDFVPYVNRVKAISRDRVYSLPINLLTINQFFGRTLAPAEAREFVASLGDHAIHTPCSFEEWALRFIGRELYEAFFEGYTLKQWGIHPSLLPASIIKRLPLSFDYNDNYYRHRYQGIPRHGYTTIVERLLDAQNIELRLGTQAAPGIATEFDHVFCSGSIDAWYDYAYGPLEYRTLDFERLDAEGDYQGCAVMNYCDASVPWTRISEHKHFAPWESHAMTVCFREYSRRRERGDIPYYPVRLVHERAALQRYVAHARQQERVTFVGRLGTYRYLDMDVTIREAMDAAQRFLDCLERSAKMPAFNIDPMAS
ncbi:MAG: FAD-dependent oxidoreductase [Gammaproteobacteria bacterium]|nr:FAD-dependent oxidoreductase [Gammaproteobacteria bacterium]